METTIREAAARASGVDRRRHARVQLVGELEAELVGSGTPLVVLDLSETGFSVESPVGFAPRQDYRVKFSTPRRSHGILHAVNVHCLHASMASGPVYYAGFQFSNSADAVAIRAMLLEVQAIRTASRA